ncbi:glycosyltransferase [Asanoa sp. WMMD1127]|uniref:glycosyltransferase n=1 Tax=Asanoa sp. WMMD1127 TaxID=3016107 RepID=UPI002416C8B4|nr:glycosyltransferase [Asanoa sp. WMMD1127]MDG4825207.1 glycosyltransferase [Asanoa sp. WMMD1127]
MRSPLLAGRRVAVVHEWFSAHGGSEDVFLAIAGLVPHATRYVLWAEPDAPIDGLALRQSWLARTPLRRSKALALPLMPLAWRTLGRPAPDVVISSSHAFAHTVKLGEPDATRHLSYVHSPARYLWSPAFDGRGANPVLALPRRVLQGVDRRASRHVHAYAANSAEVRARIQRYWRRDATVVHPPVDTDFFAAAAPEGPAGDRDYLLGVGRWIPYKNFALIIEIAARAGLPLVIAGGGPEEVALRRSAQAAPTPVHFEHRPTRERLRALYQGARALLFPAHEDFGIVPVEAQAAGTPVVGLRRGGLCETVVDGETGFLVDSLDPAAYRAALARLPELDTDRIRRHAAGFATTRFQERMAGWVADATR